jgi:hypothetical protein
MGIIVFMGAIFSLIAKTLTDAARMLPVEKRDPVSAAHRRHADATRSGHSFVRALHKID